jgi:hypothetical protein
LQEKGARTLADATAWRAESGIGRPTGDGRWPENGDDLTCPLGDADACQFRRASTRLCWPVSEETESCSRRFWFYRNGFGPAYFNGFQSSDFNWAIDGLVFMLQALEHAGQPLLERAFCPPAPRPQPRPLSPLALIRTLKRNPLECWAMQHFERPIVAGGLPIGHVLLVHDPNAIRHVLLENVANYRKDRLQRRVLLVLAAIVKHFRFQLQPGHAVWPTLSVTLRPANGLPMIVTRRAS